jgi:hypothetical protein
VPTTGIYSVVSVSFGANQNAYGLTPGGTVEKSAEYSSGTWSPVTGTNTKPTLTDTRLGETS